MLVEATSPVSGMERSTGIPGSAANLAPVALIDVGFNVPLLPDTIPAQGGEVRLVDAASPKPSVEQLGVRREAELLRDLRLLERIHGHLKGEHDYDATALNAYLNRNTRAELEHLQREIGSYGLAEVVEEPSDPDNQLPLFDLDGLVA